MSKELQEVEDFDEFFEEDADDSVFLADLKKLILNASS
jgi:hypothetical protein